MIIHRVGINCNGYNSGLILITVADFINDQMDECAKNFFFLVLTRKSGLCFVILDKTQITEHHVSSQQLELELEDEKNGIRRKRLKDILQSRHYENSNETN